MSERIVERDGVRLVVEEAGDGIPIVLLHGLTATRRYVVMGSKALERGGHRVISYDARAHGQSSPAPTPDAYGYDELALDLLAAMDSCGLERAVLAGASMGAHTLLRAALDAPARVAGVVVVTPAFDPDAPPGLARWDALAEGLRSGGIEGFVEAYRVEDEVPEAWRNTVRTVLRQRMAQHADLDALADALQATPRSRPFASLDELGALSVPAVVVASRDDADPGHPLAIGEAYAAAIPGARLITEPEGRSPLAWQGGQLSRVIEELVAETA
ncbi:MAG TPA: alpha/beta hydrolase [Conexibacter sp.]|jgi:pimeloyl-ACP methyl ester carboxylesterase|nr:alpha/beta hydrolase [Conexibacter sp.]